MLPVRPLRFVAGLITALAAWAFLASPAPAADPAAPDTSLKLVPADADFYSAMLRNKEQLDLVADSRAWAKLWSLPSVQQAWTAIQGEYNNPVGNLAALRQIMQDPDNQDLVALIGDAFSDEVFCYGDESWADLNDLYQEAYAANQYQPLLDQLNNRGAAHPAEENQARSILSALAKHLDQIKVPNLVIGFKVSNPQQADKQIQRLEKFARQLAEQIPDLKARLKRKKVGDGSFLTLTVDGSQVPWDQVPWKQLEDKPGEFAPVIDKLRGLTLTLSLGVEHGYVILGIGPSTDFLASFGGKGPRLDGRPEFKPLARFADRKVTSIGYSSKAYQQHVLGGYDRQMDASIEMAKAGLAKADLSEADQKALLKMLTDLRGDMQAQKQNIGSEMSFSFLTDRGYEGYAYDYSKQSTADSSKPLTLLNHLGGSPLLAVVGRSKPSVEDYETFAKAVQDAFPRLDKIVEGKLNQEDKQTYEKAKEDFLPLVKRLNETTDKLFLPALADGQFGFVIDAKWTSKRWFQGMPETDKAMPAPEVGIVAGVSDAEALRKAMDEYRAIANDALAKIKTWPGADKVVGDFQIPPPQAKVTRIGTFYFYPIPESWGVDPQFQPTAGLSNEAAALALSRGHAARLLASLPLKVDGGPLADRDRPLSGAAYIDWAGIVDAATPWVEFGTEKILDAQPVGNRQAVMSQVRTVLDVLKCFRGVTSATYLEDGVQVTHHESVFRDLTK